MKDDLRYTPSDCFETFPFPDELGDPPRARSRRQGLLRVPRRAMVRNDEGLTKTYNRFHDPDERDPEILQLRELHAAMDRAVLDAYGWTDIPTDCEFLLDYEIDEEESGQQEEALALPLARRGPRRGARAPPRAERRARGGGAALGRRRRDGGRKRATKRVPTAPETEGLVLMTVRAEPTVHLRLRSRCASGSSRPSSSTSSGPGAGHALADERLPGWVRPSNWYLTGFLIPSGTPPEQSADADEDDDFDEVPESAGLARRANEERKAAKKGFFPSSMGLSFLVRAEATRADA